MPEQGEYRILRDVVYATVMGFRPLALDLHLPVVSGAPIILFLHGGGWRMGSRSTFTPTISVADSFERIVAAGFAVAAVDYRLSGEAHFPAQVDDVRAALAWLREHAAEYDLDGSRIVMWGESAGATIAALVALEPSSGVAGVIDWYGPANLISMAELGTPEEAVTSREGGWLGVSALVDPERGRAASPVFAVREGAPPFYIAHGAADNLVPFSQSQELASALEAHGNDVRLVAVEGASHMWKELADPAALVEPALEFARERTATSHADQN